jgi:hypothetical protein
MRKDHTNWEIEGVKQFGPNVVQATLVSGKARWNLIRAYIPPSEIAGSTLDCIQQTAEASQQLTILLGNLNTNLQKIGDTKRHPETATLIASLGLTDLMQHFRGCLDWRSWTWSQLRLGRRFTSICDYILADTREDFRAIRIIQPRGFDSDHRLIYANLTLQSNSRHQSYMQSRKRYPIRPLVDETTINEADKIMVELTAASKIAKKPTICHKNNSWILEKSWNLVDANAEARRTGQISRALELEKLRKKALLWIERKC